MEEKFVKDPPECCWTDRRQTGRTEGDRWTETWRGKTSQDSPPVTVVGGNAAPTHCHTFVAAG